MASTTSKASPADITTLAGMITTYLGPNVARGGSTGATLNALRVRLETGVLADKDHTTLSWQVREAIRTEFFRIKYPAPPAPALVFLVMTTEVLLTNHTTTPRPYYFPGGRATVPVDPGVRRRSGTTLQLRFKPGPNPADPAVTEALVHLDGEKGGAFRWVQVAALAPMSDNRTVTPVPTAYPPPPVSAPSLAPGLQPAPPPAAHQALLQAQAAAMQAAAQRQREAAAAHAQRREKANAQKLKVQVVQARMLAKVRREEIARLAKIPTEPPAPIDALPPTFVPDCLRAVEGPPRKRLRQGLVGPTSLASGSVGGAGRALCPSQAGTRGSLLGAGPAGDVAAGKEVVRSDVAVAPLSSPSSSSSTGRSKVSVAVEPLAAVSPSASGDVGVKGGAFDIAAGSQEPPQQRSLAAVTEKVLVLERVVARRKNLAAGGVVEFFVKWRDADWESCTWESREALLQDVPGVVERFEMEHPSKPALAEGVAREAAAGEQAEHDRRVAEIKASAEAKEEARKEKERTKGDDILVPVWFDAPIAELSFGGSGTSSMVMHVRRDGGTKIFNDPMAAGRDVKKRRVRLREEYPEEASRLAPLSKIEVENKERNDARVLVENSAKAHKLAGSRLINFPRALGSALPVDVAHPVSSADIQSAPPSWESYLQSLGLECVNWEREREPLMPTAGEAVSRTARHALHTAAGVLREQGKEREERLKQERIDVESGAKQVRLADCVKSSSSPRTASENMYDEDVEMYNKGNALLLDMTKKSAVDSAVAQSAGGGGASSKDANSDVLLSQKSRLFARALEVAKSSEGEGGVSNVDNLAYDPFFCCWRKERS